MRLVVLTLVGLMLASCGQVGNQADDARQRGPARPETLEWTDGKGDMWAAKYVEPDGFVPKGPRPKSTNGDIRHVAVAHHRERLEIKVQYVALDDVKSLVPLRAWVDSNLGVESDISISWDGPAQETFVNIFNDGGDVDCKGASSTVDFEANIATVSVPRSCLGLPRWVRVALESEIYQSKNYQAEPAHMDNAMDAGFPANTRLDGTIIKRGLSERVYADSSSSPSGRGETTVLVSDPRGDVESMGPEGEDFSREATPAPQVKDGDILSTKVEHTSSRLRIRVEFADMPRDQSVNNYRLAAEVKTNAGAWVIEDDMEGSPVLLLEDVPVPCDIDRSTDDANRTSTLSIPRTCLGEDPAWVQIAVSLVTWQANGDATVDDAHVKGYDESTTFSRRVFKP